ncbi:DEAD/DEAH box helicase family protein [Catenovulum sp. SM1970]|uniref:DEAD/DEAH box helicase family protein n=1 Tax=Marinifaba aquimaris TaxID=2741323 RepID=UPI00157368BD|nr:DEAD/DEAH box helicase family protein [Marinifaba aquimaris]NTS78701.1 DEAD/DEAH box helicase family protein [Marinifaba aquimaris]
MTTAYVADYPKLNSALNELDYTLTESFETGFLYCHPTKTAVLVDTHLFELDPQDYHYVHYTSVQNKLMHQHQGLLRFVYDDHALFINELELFTNTDIEPENIRIFGQQRDEHHLDPTPPEYNFALIFERVFSGKALHALKAEDSYIDRAGTRRFIDYTLKRQTKPIAIELNGERYHHPLLTGKKKYRSQLFKQNSLVSDGYLVYRWSNRGMADDTKIDDQLRTYFGYASQFCAAPHYRAERAISEFALYEHQADTIKRINQERQSGKNTFLVVLPTGTGKTEVFIEDMRQQYLDKQIERVLVIVPTSALKTQMVERVKKHIPELQVGFELGDNRIDVVVQTSAYLLRHYQNQNSQHFDYILVDEAHRAAAHGLRKVLEHFTPKTLIGLTATDERLDKQKLEDIFGSYQVDLTLQQAIEKGLVPPIRAFRLSSNIDLSAVRFNGKDFVKSDLNKTVQVPSRDQLIVDVINKYFKEPLQPNKPAAQGVIFCVDVKHTKRMAKLLNNNGLTAASVHASDRKGIEAYLSGDIRFLCACELLNEGWDAPQTEIVVMARPTMSKVLYTQQLGRGTRKHPGKEALYVIDVVDSYGAALQPWSLHGLFNLNQYQPFENIIEPEQALHSNEILILDGLWEGERRIEPINIFNFEKEFGDLLNEEQLARELFVSTGTVKSWLKKGDIQADKSLPFGRATLNYFETEQVEQIRVTKKLKQRTEQSRYDDFFEFLAQRDYTFSYKIAFMLAFLKHCDNQGEANLEAVTKTYQVFYKQLFDEFNVVEKSNSSLSDQSKLNDEKNIQKNILESPFEKFERKRFMYQCKDLALIAFDTVLWDKLKVEDLNKVREQMLDDGINYFEKINISLNQGHFAVFMNDFIEEPNNSNVVSLKAHQIQVTEEQKLISDNAPEILDSETTALPFYPNIKIACGHFKTGFADEQVAMELGLGYGNLDPTKHFLAHASGNSMNGGRRPILDGDLLLLEWVTSSSAGSITGSTMVIEQQDGAGDNQYILRVIKKQNDGSYWLHAQNPDYEDIPATSDFRTLARLKAVVSEK